MWWWIVVAALLLLLFFLPSGCSVRLKGLFREPVSVIQNFVLGSTISLKAGIDTVRGFGGLAEENRMLRQEIIKLQADERIHGTLEEENKRLSELLGFKNNYNTDLISARVVRRSINGWWQSVGLSKGYYRGIQSDRAVISPDGLVGRTDNVASFSSEVILVSDPDCKVSGLVSRTGSFGLVTGCGVNKKGYPIARMQFIDKDAPVCEGDEIVTSGLGGIFPRNIVIGYVEKVYTEEAGLYQIADVVPQALTTLSDVVFIATKGGD